MLQEISHLSNTPISNPDLRPARRLSHHGGLWFEFTLCGHHILLVNLLPKQGTVILIKIKTLRERGETACR